MERPPDSAGILDAARDYWKRGLPIIPLRGKVPAISGWQGFERTAVSLRFWFGTKRCNVGLVTGAYVVIDSDTKEAEAWIKQHGIDSPMLVRSGGGGLHRYFDGRGLGVRNRQGLHWVPGLDVRGDGGFIVLPPSIHPETGERYEILTELLPVESLPRFRPEWYAEKRREPRMLRSIAARPSLSRREIEHVRRRIRRTWAVSGKGGHNATFAVSCELVEAGLSFEEVLAELGQWNVTNAVPLWSERELIHKARSAFEKVLGRRMT
jgi:Bifunctional DNA primase/polymerase, N-terminal